MTIRFKVNPVEHIRITSPFGTRKHPVTGITKLHNGIDLAPRVSGKAGDPVSTVADGVVVVSKTNNGGVNVGYGYYTVVQHAGFATLYAHLSKLTKRVGDKVKAGDVIGYMGNTGYSTGVHLHFGLTDGNYWQYGWIDPKPYLLTGKEVEDLTEDETRKLILDILYGKDSKASPWAKGSWDKSTKEGFVDGTRPRGYATREEVNALFRKILDK